MNCSVDGCANPVKARGFCTNHWWRWRHHGDPLAGGPSTRIGEARAYFHETMWTPAAHDPGWIYARRGGYGLLGVGDGKMQGVHVLACIAAHGEKPFPGAEVLHSCDVRHCFWPEHLSWGTHAENMRQASERGRMKGGPRGGGGRPRSLTPDQVARIMRCYALGLATQTELADSYGVSQKTISNVVRGQYPS
jgi:hypothetical protein